MENPVRLAIIEDPDNWDDESQEWLKKLNGRPIEVVKPSSGDCCGCLHFVPPMDVIDLIPDRAWGIKEYSIKYID
jgi:hypothetical protein